MSKPIIQKEVTKNGIVVLTFSGEKHEEQMVFRSNKEFQRFFEFLILIDALGAKSIEKIR